MSDAPAPVNNSPAPAPTSDTTETPAAEAKRMLKAKVNGRDVDVSESDMIRDYQKYSSADGKLREAAASRKQIDAFYAQLESDPESILNDPRMSIDKQKLAMKWLTEQLQSELGEPSDPRDIELADYKKKLGEFENRDKEAKDAKDKTEYEGFVEQRRNEIASTLSKAMELSPLSKEPSVAAETLRDMAQYMRLCRDAGYEVTPQELAQHVEQNKLKTFATLTNALEGDQLVALLGEGLINKLRKWDLGRLNKAREQPSPEQSQSWESKGERKREFIDPSALRRK